MKTNIKITECLSGKIEAALHEVNGKAVKHAFTTFPEIEWAAECAEDKLEALMLPKALRAGATWIATSGAPVANAYGNNRQGTKITLERRSAGWVLVDVATETIYKEGGKPSKLTLTRHQYDEATKRLMAGVEIKKDKVAS